MTGRAVAGWAGVQGPSKGTGVQPARTVTQATCRGWTRFCAHDEESGETSEQVAAGARPGRDSGSEPMQRHPQQAPRTPVKATAVGGRSSRAGGAGVSVGVWGAGLAWSDMESGRREPQTGRGDRVRPVRPARLRSLPCGAGWQGAGPASQWHLHPGGLWPGSAQSSRAVTGVSRPAAVGRRGAGGGVWGLCCDGPEGRRDGAQSWSERGDDWRGQTATSPRVSRAVSRESFGAPDGRALRTPGFPGGWRSVHRPRGGGDAAVSDRCDHALGQSAQEDVSSGPRDTRVAVWSCHIASGRWASPDPISTGGPGRGAGARALGPAPSRRRWGPHSQGSTSSAGLANPWLRRRENL